MVNIRSNVGVKTPPRRVRPSAHFHCVQLSGAYNITNVGAIKVNDPAISINFAALDKSVRGTTGCNSFFGNYTLDLYSLSFGDLAVTENYCEEPVMTTESALLNALRQTGSYTYENNVLTLYSKTDRSVLLTAKKEKSCLKK